MHPRLRGYLDVISIYVVIVLFGISAIDYVTIDQTKRVSGLTMLILIAAILIGRLLARQQRQINAMKARLQHPGAEQPSAPHFVPRAPSASAREPNSNVLDFTRR